VYRFHRAQVAKNPGKGQAADARASASPKNEISFGKKKMESPLESISSYFGRITDPRNAAQVSYPLGEILFLVLTGMICDCEDWEDIEDFGNEQLAWLRGYHAYERGIPAHDTLNRVMGMIDHQEFSENFIAWMGSWAKLPEQMLISLDGKTARRSHDRFHGKKAIHNLSAYCQGLGMVLGQVATEEKSNEITAIPALLDLLSIQGAVITIDAMGTQPPIAEKIIKQKGNYILALKGNQASLYDEVKDCFNRLTPAETHEEIEKNRGRIETRKVSVITDLGWITDRDSWPGLKQLVRVESRREMLASGKAETEVRFYISSTAGTAGQLQGWIRGHWGIENPPVTAATPITSPYKAGYGVTGA
jgi:predicted transposase YbfD/YdcC